MDNIQLVEKLQADKEKLFQEISKIIIGQKEIIGQSKPFRGVSM